MYKLHTHCRACGYGKPSGPPGIKSSPSGEKLIEAMGLGLQPLANNFCGPDDEHHGFAPLKVMLCPRCSLAQLSVVVKPEILYSNYLYTTSKSATMQEHFDRLWVSVCQECNPESVVEIGSNDGDFLDYARKHGAGAVCGIDPAANLTEIANRNGIQTFTGVFDEDTAKMARACVPPVSLVIARHVFAHIDDWLDFLFCLDVLCAKDTLVVIEVPYVCDMLKNVEFDTIYHEHLSYISIRAMEALLETSPFQLERIVRFPIHGGSVGIMIKRRNRNLPQCKSVQDHLDNEKATVKEWGEFKEKSVVAVGELDNEVRALVDQGSKVVGYGAAAKSTVWLDCLEFTKKEIGFICDSTPGKWGKCSPGSDIPIVDEGALLRELPNYAILFAWVYEREILEKNKLWRGKGGKFIIPGPEVRIV